MRARGIPFAFVLLLACGGPETTPPRHANNEVEPPPDTLPGPSALAREGTIARGELDAVLAGGLGRFLSNVLTEPHLEEGRFVGFRLTELRSPFFEGVDLRAGDTLLSVNGLPIERPEEAMQVWSGLRVASELTLEVMREGETRQLRFGIED
jgi:hypothetical protein